MRVQGDRDNRGAPDARPRARAAGDPAEVQRRERHGLPEGEELADDIRQARQPQVQVRQQEVLGGGLLRVHRRPERGDDRQVHQGEQESHDIALDKLSVKEYEDPFKRG